VIYIVIIEFNEIEFVIGVWILFDCFPARIFCIGFHTPEFDVNIPRFVVEIAPIASPCVLGKGFKFHLIAENE